MTMGTDGSHRPSDELAPHIAWSIAILTMMLAAISYVDRQTLASLSLAVTHALDLSETQYGALQSAFAFAYLVSVPLCGIWIVRIQARRGLVISMVVWSTVAALHAAVPTFGVLFVLRIALGLTEGPGFPAVTQTITRIMPERHRPRAFSMLFAGSSIGSMIVAPLSIWIYNAASWRVAFLTTAIAGTTWLVPWLLLTRRHDIRTRLDARPSGSRGELAGFRQLIAHPLVHRAVAVTFVAAPLQFFVLAWAPKFLNRTLGVTQGDLGSYLWLPPLGLDAGALLFGDLAARLRRAPGEPPRMLAACAMLLGASVALAPLATSPWQATAIFTVTMAGNGALSTLVTADLLVRVPRELVPVAAGLLTTGFSLSGVLVNPLIGWSVDATHGFVVSTLGVGALVIPGTLVWILWRPRRFSPS
jgi:ACS family hexuronate transporter-like MFS transporter